MAASQPKSWRCPFAGIFFSWVPQPSSAGCRPSEAKPSTDQVLTNTPRGLGSRARWVSRSAIWMPLTPARCISRAQSSRVFGSSKVEAELGGDVDQRLLDQPRHHPGIGAAAAHRGDAARPAPAQRQQALAQRIVRARRDRQIAVGVKSRPRLDDGVDVERVDILGELRSDRPRRYRPRD